MILRPHQQRAVDLMQLHKKGQIIVPTGGGKTMNMIKDAMIQFQQNDANANAN
jgi:superfamily II DNA or RNA helicase